KSAGDVHEIQVGRRNRLKVPWNQPTGRKTEARLCIGRLRWRKVMAHPPDPAALENREHSDLIEMSKQGYFTLMLDESIRVLEGGLNHDGFKVVITPQGLEDDVLKRQAKGWAILTRNSKDLVGDAVRYDYDVIGIEDINIIDDKPDRTNQTVQ